MAQLMPAIYSFFLALFAVAVLSACGSGNSQGFNSQDVGGLRVINAVSDSPAVSFFVENNSFGSLQFGQATLFTSVRDGRYDITAGYTNSANESITLLDDERVRVEVEEQTTLVLAGTLAAPIALEIEAPNPVVATDVSEIQVLNTAGAGSVDVYIGEPAGALGAPLATAAANGVSAVASTSAGTRRVRLTATGNSEVIFDSGEFALPGGERILLHVKPYFGPGDNPLTIGLISSTRTTSFPNQQLPVDIRVANAIGDMPAADVSITNDDGVIDITGLASNSLSDPQQTTPGAAEIAVTMQTDPGTVFVTNSARLVGGERRTLIAAGNFADSSTTGRLAVDPQRPISTVAQINFMHGSASSGRVDAYLLSGDATVSGSTASVANLALLANSNVEVAAGTYSLVFTNNGAETELAGPLTITVNNSSLYTILLTDAENGGTPPQIIRGSNFE